MLPINNPCSRPAQAPAHGRIVPVMKVAYPHAHLIERLDTPLLALKIARHSPCTKCSDCPGIHPPRGVDVVPDGHSDSSLGDLGQYGSDDDDEVASSYLERCACGHIVEDHNADDKILGRSEFDRRARVAVRLDELLLVSTAIINTRGYLLCAQIQRLYQSLELRTTFIGFWATSRF